MVVYQRLSVVVCQRLSVVVCQRLSVVVCKRKGRCPVIRHGCCHGGRSVVDDPDVCAALYAWTSYWPPVAMVG